ncbi:glioma tumor suppressor candidate region gene 1 protein-like isoform X2 [Arapaima gigas]
MFFILCEGKENSCRRTSVWPVDVSQQRHAKQTQTLLLRLTHLSLSCPLYPQLENEDLLINSSPGGPLLFADAPSPVSLLADDTPSQDTPASGCVDLSFLEEALLSSPDAGRGPEVGAGGPAGAAEEEEEEACDILQQSLQEADITEQTLALEAGLALPGDGLSLYTPPGTLIAPLASQFLPKPISTSPPLPAMPRDTQAAVEPPQPSLLAVGPGCPSLKPAAPQLMGLLPGTVFPGTPPEASLSLSPAQGSGMLVQKAVPGLANRPLVTAALRATAAPGILLPRGPLPIQPKLPVNIQPRLVQISPKLAGQKTSPSLTLVQGTASPNILLSPPLGPKPPATTPQLSKPVSLQLLNQGGSIVIQPQGIFPGHNQFLVPSQPPATLAQPAGQPGPSARGGAPARGHLVDSPQILAGPPQQLNFSPVFTTPTGQLALRQGALLSGPLQLQSTPPAVFQMPAQLTGTYAPQGQGPRGALLQSAALGGHITLINSQGMLPPDVASISIVNGPSVVQGVPFVAQAQRPVPGGSEGHQGLPQPSVLLLPESTAALEEKGSGAEQLLQIPQVSLSGAALASGERTELHLSVPDQHLHHRAPPPCRPELQPSPRTDVPLLPDPPAALPNHLLPPGDGQRVPDGAPSPAPPKHDFVHHLQQAFELPCSSSVTLQGQVALLAGQREASTPTLPPAGQAGASATTSTRPGTDQTASPNLPPGGGQTDGLSGTGSSQAVIQAEGGTPVPPAPSPLSVSVSAALQQPAPLPACAGPQVHVDPPPQQHLLAKAEPVSAAETKVRCFGLCPASPSTHPPQQHGQASVRQPSTQVTACKSKAREEKVTPAMRRHRYTQLLCRDHAAVLDPDARSPFLSVENAVSRLLPYHTCAGCLPGHSDFLTVDQQFEGVSALLLKRTKDMFNKYRQLLLGEAQQVSPSAEMVMLERLFLQAERGVLGEERRKARLEPDSFLPFSSPPSPPPWALLSDRPPGLKTYRSSSRGALKLTIKHESGSRKVVHNSACDVAHASPGEQRQDGAGRLTNGGGSPGSRGEEQRNPPAAGGTSSPADDHGGARAAACVATAPDPRPRAPTSLALRPPKAKRVRWEPEREPPGLPAQAEDHALSEHLQSAIDSILELQRLQGRRRDGGLGAEPAVAGITDGRR